MNGKKKYGKMFEMMKSCCSGEGEMTECCLMMWRMMGCGGEEESKEKKKENEGTE